MDPTPDFFLPEERSEAVLSLTAFAASQPTLAGVLLVGSGAHGFADSYSDVDVVMVADDATYSAALHGVTDFAHQLSPMFMTAYQHRDDVTVCCLLLDNYLELDIGIWSLGSLFASSPYWQLLQARDKQTAQHIIAALAQHPPLTRSHEPVNTGDDPLWQFVYGQYVATARHDAAKLVFYREQLASYTSPLTARDLHRYYRPEQVSHLLPLLP